MTSYNSEERSLKDDHLVVDQLVQLLSDEVSRAEVLAQDLQEARETNSKYLEAIEERDCLLREYIESLQTLRANMRKGSS